MTATMCAKKVAKAERKEMKDGTSSHTNSTVCSDDDDNNNKMNSPTPSLPQTYARSIATRPLLHLLFAFVATATLTTFVVTRGNFRLRVDAVGFFSRHTPIADRITSFFASMNVNAHTMTDNEKKREEGWNRRMDENNENENTDKEDATASINALLGPLTNDPYCSGSWYGSERMTKADNLHLTTIWKTIDVGDTTTDNKISATDANALYEMCVAEESNLRVLDENEICHKCPVVVEEESSTPSNINHDVEESRCMKPYSLVTLARFYLLFLEGSINPLSNTREFVEPSLSCDDLRSQWTDAIEVQFTSLLETCTNYMLEQMGIRESTGKYDACAEFPINTAPIVDDKFLLTGIVRYTTSIYATKADETSVSKLYDLDQSNRLVGVPSDKYFEHAYHEVSINSLYTTPKQGFYERYLLSLVPRDAAVSIGSLIVTTGCILFHTKSPFLTLMGLFQIVLALPVAYFVYYFVCGLPFFPFANVNALFIVFALGADDIFVVVDKWKMKRRQCPPQSTTVHVAMAALPNAASATFVTSITTAVAFFASSIINVPAISLFSLYCGWLIAVDYVLCIWIMFPALCIYDCKMRNGSTSRWWSFNGCCRNETEDRRHADKRNDASVNDSIDDKMRDEEEANEPEEEGTAEQPAIGAKTAKEEEEDANDGCKKSWGQRIYIYYYRFLHKFRWAILISVPVVIGVCIYFAFQFKAPDDPDPSFLPQGNRYEIHRVWARRLLLSSIARDCIGVDYFIWGLVPVDTGFGLDPSDPTEVVFDNSFNPRAESTQIYLADICDTMFQGEEQILREISCPMQEFDAWLAVQSQTDSPSREYVDKCNGADSVPVSPEVFDSCMIAHFGAKGRNGEFIAHDGGVVKTIIVRGWSNTTAYSRFVEQEKEWKALEAWSETERSHAPEGANSFFQVSHDFWMYDTMDNMRQSLWKSALIALACASAMILLTSHSVRIVVFATISIVYVLVASSACLVGLGWTLGIFESILFALLIGIGCDFVLHFGHAYTMFPGIVSKEHRTRRALLHMGPSVMGSAVTTLSTAFIMLLAENSFSKKFAAMLIMTIVHSVIGSFVIFLVLCDCFGPNSTCFRNLLEKDAKERSVKPPVGVVRVDEEDIIAPITAA